MMSKMEFDCKLAHSEEVKKISNFNSIKQLYQRISQLFGVPINEILYCTLNTHDFRNTDALLGNYLSLGDLIVVHICGKSKEVNLKKAQEYLGLTITDNGYGRAFIKKTNENDEINKDLIKPGDHIAAINSQSTIGLRHYEVAKAIREVPQHTYFIMHLIEPLHLDNYLNITSNTKKSTIDNDDDDSRLLSFSLDRISRNESNNKFDRSISESLYEDLTNSSLPIDRLLSKSSGNANQDADQTQQLANDTNDSYRLIIDKINSILESFLGINDNALAIQIYRLAKENKNSYEDFVNAVRSSDLSVFNFGENIETYLWNCVK